MKAEALRELANTELNKKLSDLREELFNLRFQKVTGQLENPQRLSHIRRSIARIRTVQRERELIEAQQA